MYLLFYAEEVLRLIVLGGWFDRLLQQTRKVRIVVLSTLYLSSFLSLWNCFHLRIVFEVLKRCVRVRDKNETHN